MVKLKKKVTGILNKLAADRFESLCDQLLQLMLENYSLPLIKEVVMIIFDKATSQTHFAALYSDLCRRISDSVPGLDDNGHLTEPNPPPPYNVKGKAKRSPFKRLLANKCQMEFEFVEQHKVLADQRGRVLGVIRFIGELFKNHMLSEKIMHKCIQFLLEFPLNEPVEDFIEAATSLLITIGKKLDTPAAQSYMHVYFNRFESLAAMDSSTLSSRHRFMCRDVIDLRERAWIPRQKKEDPKTKEEVHKEAQAEQTAKAAGPARPNPRRDSVTLASRNTSNSMPLGMGLGMGMGMGMGMGLMSPSDRERESRARSGSRDQLPSRANAAAVGGKVPRKVDRYARLQDDGPSTPSSASASSLSASAPASALVSAASPKYVPVTPKATAPPASLSSPASVSTPRSQPAEEDTEALDAREQKVLESAKDIMREYLQARDVKEVKDCIADMGDATMNYKIVHGIFEVAIETNKSEITADLQNLLLVLLRDDVLSRGDLTRGMIGLLKVLDDITTDMPLAPKIVAGIVATLVNEGLMNLDFLDVLNHPEDQCEEIQMFAEGPAPAKLVAAIFANVTGIAIFAANIDVTPMLHGKSLKSWVVDNKLEAVYPLIDCEAELLDKLRNRTAPAAIVDWLRQQVANTTAPIFVSSVLATLVDYAVSLGSISEEKEVLAMYVPLMKAFLPSPDDRSGESLTTRINALYAVQLVFTRRKHPEGMMSRIFNYLYSNGLIADSQAFLFWKDQNLSDVHAKDKAVALRQLQGFYDSHPKQ